MNSRLFLHCPPPTKNADGNPIPKYKENDHVSVLFGKRGSEVRSKGIIIKKNLDTPSYGPRKGVAHWSYTVGDAEGIFGDYYEDEILLLSSGGRRKRTKKARRNRNRTCKRSRKN